MSRAQPTYSVGTAGGDLQSRDRRQSPTEVRPCAIGIENVLYSGRGYGLTVDNAGLSKLTM